MKITCTLCGGELRVNCGGKDATCVNCGLTYPMERLREMLTGRGPSAPEATNVETNRVKTDYTNSWGKTDATTTNSNASWGKVNATPTSGATGWDKGNDASASNNMGWGKTDDAPIYDVVEWEKVDTVSPTSAHTAEQFVMEISGAGKGCIYGRVRQGGIGLGDVVYLDDDYGTAYTVDRINGKASLPCAKAGMTAELNLPTCLGRTMKKARKATGVPNPAVSAYNYPGTAEEYFSQIFSDQFAEYEIRRNMTHEGLKIPANYLLCREGTPVLAVFLVHSKDGKSRYQLKKAAELLGREGVRCTHFYEDYRNDEVYVLKRVQDALR